jgi:hypothetical protein
MDRLYALQLNLVLVLNSNAMQLYNLTIRPCTVGGRSAHVTFLQSRAAVQSDDLIGTLFVVDARVALLQVDLGPMLQPLCRHSMAVSGEACYIFGGYDGSHAIDLLLHIDLQPVLQLQRSSIADLARSMACCGAVHQISNAAERSDPAAAAGVGKAALRALSKAAAPAPLKLADLPNAKEVAAMPQWKQIRQLHQVSLGQINIIMMMPAQGQH